jgi:hypothetical protein
MGWNSLWAYEVHTESNDCQWLGTLLNNPAFYVRD